MSDEPKWRGPPWIKRYEGAENACPQCGAKSEEPCIRKNGQVRLSIHRSRMGAQAPKDKPTVDDAPGLVWAPRKSGWVAEWHARTDLIRRGFLPQRMRVWAGEQPSEADRLLISDQCTRLQNEMLVWGRGGIPKVGVPLDETLGGLIRSYQTDPDSGYQELRYASRKNADSRCKLIEDEYGEVKRRDIDARLIKGWHRKWSDGGKVTSAHGKVGQLRTVFGFGATILEDKQCLRLRDICKGLRFKMGQHRKEYITADQALAVIAKAHELGWHSIARAQAFQFECTLRQKDVIGEWVPISDPNFSTLTSGQWKWLRGLRGEEIDGNLILRHTTSKKQKPVEVNLRLAPMVMADLDWAKSFPAEGPLIICESTQRPWQSNHFRNRWRRIARAAGIPNATFNMDSRAGAITEASEVSDMDDVRRTAAHSNVSQTNQYAREDAKAIARVMTERVAGRNKPGTDQ